MKKKKFDPIYIGYLAVAILGISAFLPLGYGKETFDIWSLFRQNDLNNLVQYILLVMIAMYLLFITVKNRKKEPLLFVLIILGIRLYKYGLAYYFLRQNPAYAGIIIFGIGNYVFLVGILLLIIYLFAFKEEVYVSYKKEEIDLKNHLNIDNNGELRFVLGTYVYGFKDLKSQSNCLMFYHEFKLKILVEHEPIFQADIDVNKITDISVKKTVKLVNTETLVRNYHFARTYLNARILNELGTIPGIYGGWKFIKNLIDPEAYAKEKRRVELMDVFDIEIEHEVDNKARRMFIEVCADPSDFIKAIHDNLNTSK